MKKIGSIKRIGSLSPDKDFQDRVIIYSRGGVSPTLRATDHKDPIKVIRKYEKR